jgi:hypothetical protein
MSIALETPVVIGTGHTTTHGLLLTNLSDRDIAVHQGQLDRDHHRRHRRDDRRVRRIPDPPAGDLHCPPVRIPVLIGTASFTSELGYAIPPGVWHLTAPMDFADGRHLLTPALELTITD